MIPELNPPHYNTGLLMGSALTPIGLFTFNFIIHCNDKVKLKIFTFRIFKKTIITIVIS